MTLIRIVATLLFALILPIARADGHEPSPIDARESFDALELFRSCVSDVRTEDCRVEELADFFRAVSVEAERRRNETQRAKLDEATRLRAEEDRRFREELSAWADATFDWYPGDAGSTYLALRDLAVQALCFTGVLAVMALMCFSVSSERNMEIGLGIFLIAVVTVSIACTLLGWTPALRP